MVDIKTKGIGSGHEDVNSEIKFEFINEEGVLDVPLDDVFVAIDDVFDVSGQEDTFALWKCLGFHDVGAGFAFFDAFVVVSELAELHGDGPGLGEEVVLFGEVFFHGHES